MSNKLTDYATGEKVEEVEIGDKCPHCGSNGFSITPVGTGIRPPDWASNVLGVSDCSCQSVFLVKLAPTLLMSVLSLIDHVYRDKKPDNAYEFLREIHRSFTK